MKKGIEIENLIPNGLPCRLNDAPRDPPFNKPATVVVRLSLDIDGRWKYGDCGLLLNQLTNCFYPLGELIDLVVGKTTSQYIKALFSL